MNVLFSLYANNFGFFRDGQPLKRIAFDDIRTFFINFLPPSHSNDETKVRPAFEKSYSYNSK